MKEEIIRQASFGENGNLWLESLLAKLRGNQVIKRLKNIPQPERILDLGCGYYGEFLPRAVKLFPAITEAVGVDLAVVNKNADARIKLLTADLNQPLPLTPESFDAAVSLATFEHLGDSHLAFEEIYRLLKRGGEFIVTTPAPRAKKILEFLAIRLGWLEKRGILAHRHYFDISELKRELSQAGFQAIRVKTFQFGFNILATAKKQK